MTTPQFKIQLDPGASLPTRATNGSVGYDVKCISFTSHDIFEHEYDITDVLTFFTFCLNLQNLSHIVLDTGIHITPPPGYYVELLPNSRQSKRNVSWNNSLGVIDPDYTGSIKVIIKKASLDLLHYLPGNTIGQLIIRKKHDADWLLVDQLDTTQRGSGGFGSTENIAKSAQ